MRRSSLFAASRSASVRPAAFAPCLPSSSIARSTSPSTSCSFSSFVQSLMSLMYGVQVLRRLVAASLERVRVAAQCPACSGARLRCARCGSGTCARSPCRPSRRRRACLNGAVASLCFFLATLNSSSACLAASVAALMSAAVLVVSLVALRAAALASSSFFFALSNSLSAASASAFGLPAASFASCRPRRSTSARGR